MVDKFAYLQHLGLKKEEAKLYILLNELGSQTAQQLAKQAKLPKTSVYRYLETLEVQGLVEQVVDEHTTRFKAASPDHLALLVSAQTNKARILQERLPEMTQQLMATATSTDPETEVKFYRGEQGIRQMVWNINLQRTEVVGYTYRSFRQLMGPRQFADWIEEFTTLGSTARDLYSDQYWESCTSEEKQGKFTIPDIESRYISPQYLDINHQLDIYQEVVAIYNWYEGEVFGVEIHNQKVARMQRQIFEAMWRLGEKRD